MRQAVFPLLFLGLAAGADCVDIRALYSDTYRKCIENSGGTTMAVTECQDAELRRQDKKLNEAYMALKKEIAPSRRAALRKMQRAWIRYRDAKCGFFRHEKSGSGAANDEMQCLVDETIKRTVELRFDTF
ncbi:lysozyme inhibitor LprI family protein [Hydrogenimonas urashimensis]|uniref:lysozyme inhibitor LprI family protein n=1 Tax=Hydrogenimonas urashimensis TaxID=2740515 RepID=UPI001915AA7B|nr:lysozyme inhibitor LprI family protein [Hydrogenimonas urashimensis]